MNQKAIVVIALMLAAMMFVIVGCSQGPVPNMDGTTVSSLSEMVSDRSDALARQKAEHEAELKQPFWALLLGGDTRANTLEGSPAEYGTYGIGYSDTMILMKVWPEDGAITLLSVPRDSQAFVDGASVKINEVLKKQGTEASVAKVEEMTGIEIKYSFVTDFARFVAAIDALGGVDVVAPIDMSYTGIVADKTRYNLSAGENHLDGESALGFARARKIFRNDHEACRQVQDRQIIQRILEAGTNTPVEERSVYRDVIDSFIDTNLPLEDLDFYINFFNDDIDTLSFKSGTLPYNGYIQEDTQEWMIPHDESAWKEVIAKVEEGGDPTEIVPLPTILPG